MSPVEGRPISKAARTGSPSADHAPLPRWIPPQLCQLVETAPSGPQWLHEIKLDGFRMSARLSSRGKGRESDARFRNLCRRLGFGLLGVLPNGEVEILVSSIAPMPRKNTRSRSRLVEEHRRRRGDPAEGGGSRTPIMTAYRQRALACAGALAQAPRRPRDLKASIPDAYNILHRNVYGWFGAVERGVYDLTETGWRALLRWPQMISSPDLQYPVIGVSRPTIASRSTKSEPG